LNVKEANKFNFVSKSFLVKTCAIYVEEVNQLVVPTTSSGEENSSTTQEGCEIKFCGVPHCNKTSTVTQRVDSENNPVRAKLIEEGTRFLPVYQCFL
jgi:hypothetical protein